MKVPFMYNCRNISNKFPTILTFSDSNRRRRLFRAACVFRVTLPERLLTEKGWEDALQGLGNNAT